MSQLDECSKRLEDAHKGMKIQQARIATLSAENVTLKAHLVVLRQEATYVYDLFMGGPLSDRQYKAIDSLGGALDAARPTK